MAVRPEIKVGGKEKGKIKKSAKKQSSSCPHELRAENNGKTGREVTITLPPAL